MNNEFGWFGSAGAESPGKPPNALSPERSSSRERSGSSQRSPSPEAPNRHGNARQGRLRQDWRVPAPSAARPLDTVSRESAPHGRRKEAGTPAMAAGSTYPIVAQHELEEPARQGRLKLSKRRDRSEIPKIKPHEVLVWRVGGRYIADPRQLRESDDIVVRASSVSVVSVRPDTEVQVSFRIDSKDASEFTVKVTFICSVTDPLVVVQNGQVSASEALMAHLRHYHDLFEIGLKYTTTEINEVRAEMAANVRAYMARRPLKILGMEIDPSVTVQVETPSVMANLEDIKRGHMIELRKQRGEAILDAERQEHLLDKADKVTQRVGDDPAAALAIGYVDGGISSHDLAERLQQREAEFEQRRQAEELARQTREWTVADRDAQWTRDDRREEVTWTRHEIEEKRKEERDWRGRQLEADVELLKVLGANGHLDNYYADIDGLMRKIRGDAAET